jgi:hypothetical protein
MLSNPIMTSALLPGVAALLLAATVPAAQAAAGPDWQGVTEIAAGRGERGPWRQNQSRYDFVDDPAVAIDAHGDIAVAWVDQKRKDVFFQRFSADGVAQGRPRNVSENNATFSWLPRIALAPHDPRTVYLVWQEIIFTGGSHGGDILFARSEDGGASFSEPVNLSNFSRGGDGKGRISKDLWHNGSFDLAAGADGRLHVAWTEYEGRLLLRRSTDGGKTFAGLHEIRGKHPARAPSLALGAEQTVYLAWTVGEDKAADIRVAKSLDGGETFGAPVVVARSEGYSDAPKLAVDAEGTVHLAYTETAPGPLDLRHVLYARSSDGAKTFAAPRPISHQRAGYPALALDGKAAVYVTWELFGSHEQRSRGLGIAVSRDGGATFDAPGTVPESADGGWNGSSQGLLMQKLAVNGDGRIALVNSSLEQDRRSRVWLIRASPATPAESPRP